MVCALDRTKVCSKKMEALHANLNSLSEKLYPFQLPPNATPTRLAALSNDHLAVLQNTPDGTKLLILCLAPCLPSVFLDPIEVPEDAHAIIPAHNMLAVIGKRSLTVVDMPLSRARSVRNVSSALFATRPALTVLHAAWAPHAPGFLLVLLSDTTLRLFDVISKTAGDVERLRMRIFAKAGAPVSLAFGRGHAWASLSIYVLMTDGSIFVVAPIAPIGTRLPRSVWTEMHTIAMQRAIQAKNLASSSWAARQSEMELRFLTHVFEQSSMSDMVAVREFKPAPLLFQGPLFIEHDDVFTSDVDSSDKNGGRSRFTSLNLLNVGIDVPPILLRGTMDGHVSVLVSMESVEPQWFLSSDPTMSSSRDAPVEASDEYAACAAQVAPALLCFEHLSFDGEQVKFLSFGSGFHADVLYAVTRFAVFSLRLTFVGVMSHAATLERSSPSSIVRVFTSSSDAGSSFDKTKNRIQVVGLIPHYVQARGPVAIALTTDGKLHVTAPLHWMSYSDMAMHQPGQLLFDTGLGGMPMCSTYERRAPTCSSIEKEASELIARICKVEEKVGGRVASGTLGNGSDVVKRVRVLDELERRVSLYTSGSNGCGMLDGLDELAALISKWMSSLHERTAATKEKSASIKHTISDIASCEMSLQRKLTRIKEVGFLLEERVQALMTVIENNRWDMSPVEISWYESLCNRNRRISAVRARVNELSIAVEALRRNEASRKTITSGVSSPINPRRDYRKVMDAGSPFHQRHDAMRLGGHSPLSRTSSRWAMRTAPQTPNQADLERIRMSLEKHSTEIALAMSLETCIFKRLSES